jgi:DNA-binding GntR family transcriptional regulator
LYEIRVVGEAMALRLTIPTLRTEDLARLRDELDAMATLPTGAEWLHVHRRFHHGLSTGAGDRLARTLSTLFDHAERYQRTYIIRAADAAEPRLRGVRRRRRTDRGIPAGCHIASTAEALMAAERYAPRALPDALARAKAARP